MEPVVLVTEERLVDFEGKILVVLFLKELVFHDWAHASSQVLLESLWVVLAEAYS